MTNKRWWGLIAAGVLVATLLACGKGGSSSTGLVRVVNATLTHPSLDLLVNSVATTTGVAQDTVSAFAGVPTGSTVLQINDTNGAVAIASLAPTIGSGLHYTVIVYESSGSIKTSIVGEDNVAPTATYAYMRVFDDAPDAGAIDIYVTAPTADLSTASPTFSLQASASPQSSPSFLPVLPGTYRVRVTGASNKADLRLDMPSVTVAAQQVDTVLLTSTLGGVLVNGGLLVQQGAYAATRNTNARVRLVAAIAGGATVDANAGGVPISTGIISPGVGSYAIVPAAGALAVNVASASVQVPVTNVAAGSDSTLLVYGNPTPSVSVIADDNHLPTTSSLLKMRLIDAQTGLAVPLTLSANFAVVASNVAPGTASTYGLVNVNATVPTQLNVNYPSNPAGFTFPTTFLANTGVFTVFVLGDASTFLTTTIPFLVEDR